jgi:hypothetical protein
MFASSDRHDQETLPNQVPITAKQSAVPAVSMSRPHIIVRKDPILADASTSGSEKLSLRALQTPDGSLFSTMEYATESMK